MSESYLIDGVGDELTLTLGIFVAVVIVVVSWLSTRVNDESYSSDQARETRPSGSSVDNSTHQSSSTAASDDPDGRSQSSDAVSEEQSLDDSPVDDPSPNTPEQLTSLRQRFLPQTSDNSPSGSSTSADPPTSSFESCSTRMQIKLKFMDETTQTVEASPDESLLSFRRRCLPQENQDRYRLIYQGQVLRDGAKTLREFNLVINDNDGDVVPVIHCFLSPVSSNQQGNTATSASHQMNMISEDMHIGSMFLPLLGFFLVGLWYLCIVHTSLFSIQSIVSIIGFTFLYITLVINQFL